MSASVQKPSRTRAFLRAFMSVPSAKIALAVFLALSGATILAPWIAPQNPYDLATISIMDNLLAPGTVSWEGYTH